MAKAPAKAPPAARGASTAPVSPTPVPTPPDPRLVAAAGRLGRFYTALKKRSPSAGGLELLPGDRKTGSCDVGIGPGAAVAGRTINYAAALVLAYGPYVVGAWELSGAQTVIQGWIVDYEDAARWERDPSTGLGPARYHSVNTTGFRDDFDAVIGAVDAAGPRVVASLLDNLGGVLRGIRLQITPQWCATINRRLAPMRDRLLESYPSSKHMHEDTYEVYRFRGPAARAEFGPEVFAIRDPLLKTLFEHPDGIDVLRALARSADGGSFMARAVIAEAELALQEFRTGLGADVHWRYPEFRPAVLTSLGLAAVPGLAEYLTAISDTRVRKSGLEHGLEIGGSALFVLSLLFSEGASAVLLGAAGVGVAGLGLGLAFVEDRQHALAAQAYAFERGQKRLVEPRFPVRTAVSVAALLLAAIGFYFSIRGLRAPRAPAPSGGTGPQPKPGAPPSSSPTAPSARAAGPANRLADEAAAGSGVGAKAPPPATESTAPQPPPPQPPPPSEPATPPAARPPPSAPTDPAANLPPDSLPPPQAPRVIPGKPAPGKPSLQDRATPRVPPAQRAIPLDAEQLERDAVRALETRLADEAVNYAAAQGRIADVLGELEKVPENAELVRRLKIAVGALEDQENFGKLVVELRREVDAVRNAGVPPAEWERKLGLTTDELRAAARVIGLTEETAPDALLVKSDEGADWFFREVVTSGRRFADHGFEYEHGILTHDLQGRIIGDALERNGAGTVAELRVMLAEAKAPVGWTDPEGLSIGAKVWKEIWDSNEPILGVSGLHSPEFFTRTLKYDLDFAGIAPPESTLPPEVP
jgi:hypothetical protein